MSFRIQDPIFSPFGRPGEVLDWDLTRSRLEVGEDPDRVQHAFRHGYLKGLDSRQRAELNAFLDDVARRESVADQVGALQEKIRSLEAAPDRDALQFVQYFRAELAHLMHRTGYVPRTYTVDLDRIVGST